MLLPLLDGHAHLAPCHSTLASEDTSLWLAVLALICECFSLLQNTEEPQTFHFIILLFRGFPLFCFFPSGCKVWVQITGNWLYMNHLSVVVWKKEKLFNAGKGSHKLWNAQIRQWWREEIKNKKKQNKKHRHVLTHYCAWATVSHQSNLASKPVR